MDDNDSDPNASLFPLFNFDALKQGIPSAPVNITFGDSLLKTPQDLNIARTPVAATPKPANKKRGRKSSEKKSIDSKSSLATIKEILEDDQAGVPMLTDAKMKEEKLKKMREGKAKKREQRAEGLIQSIEPQKAFEQLSEIMPSIGGKPQALLDLDTDLGDKSGVPGMRLVFKDGKPVLDDSELTEWMNKDKKDILTLVDDSKTQRLTSMSFRKKNHTKQWSPEETKKLYKAVEIFGSDFSLMTKLFPERNRAQIKNKLRKEEKENPKKVEDAFKFHEMSNKKSLMSRIEDLGRKQIKPETENDKFPSLESITNPEALNPQNRTTSTCSLDSMDLSILNDLKAIFTQESQPRTTDILGIQDKFKKESPDKESVKKEMTLNMGFTQSPEKNSSDIKAETEQAKIEFQEGKRNNLFMSMLNKQQTYI